MGKNLIILDAFNNDLIPRIISEYGEGKIVSLRASVSSSLELSGIKYEEFSYYSKKAFDTKRPYYETSLKIAFGWYFDSDYDFSKYNDISVGNLLGREMFYYVIGFLRFADGIDTLIEMESPSTVIFIRNKTWEDPFDKGRYICERAKEQNLKYKAITTANKRVNERFLNKLKLEFFSALLNNNSVKWLLWLICKFCIHPAANKSKKKILLASSSSINYLGASLIKSLRVNFELLVIDEINLNQIKLGIRYDYLKKGQFFENKKEEWKTTFYNKLLNNKPHIVSLAKNASRAEKTFDLIKFAIDRKIDKILDLIDAFNAYFQSNEIGIIVAHTDVTYLEKLVISIGHKNGVKSIVVQHGTAEHSICFFPFVADKIGVWNESVKTWFLKNGVNPEKIVVTGPSRFDKISPLPTDNYNKLLRDKPGNILLVPPAPAENVSSKSEYHLDSANCIRAFKSVVEIMKKFPQKKLIVKTKQKDSMFLFYQDYIIRNNINNVFVTNQNNAADYVDKSDFIIVVSFSDVCFLAALKNKPIIQIVYENPNYAANSLYKLNIVFSSYDNIPIYEIGASIKVDSPDKLFSAINDIYEGKWKHLYDFDSMTKAMEKYCYKRDGMACKRITDLVQRLVN